jgi:hypothetical protein
MGKMRSYSSSPAGIVKDNVTGLQWQDNTSSVKKPWQTRENYDNQDYDNTSGDTAVNYCAALQIEGYDDWRLPSIQEVQTLVDDGQEDLTITPGVFSYFESVDYWSTNTNRGKENEAFDVYFGYGYTTDSPKFLEYYVRCVRGSVLTPPLFTRDTETDIVTDTRNKLQWQDNILVETTTKNWIDAIDYCENNLTLGGYKDWRLPNKNELLSIVDYNTSNDAIYPIFKYTTPTSWTSTSTAHATKSAWYIKFEYGISDYNGKQNEYSVRCVRGGENDVFAPSLIMYLLN